MNVEAAALNETYEIAKEEAEVKVATMHAELESIREESRAIGILQKINYDTAHNELLKYVTLFQVRQNKEYKKGGMTWDQFCEAVGEQRRNVDNKLKDIRPLAEQFSEKFSGLLNVPFNKIRYLGRSISEKFSEIENGTLVIDNTPIPLTPDNKDDIEAAIDTLIETHKREKKELKTQLSKAKKHVEGVVAEETKGLVVERAALVKEVERLKKFEPAKPDRAWAKEHLQETTHLVRELSARLLLLINQEQIEIDRHLQAEIEAKITEAEAYLQDLRRQWVDKFMDEI